MASNLLFSLRWQPIRRFFQDLARSLSFGEAAVQYCQVLHGKREAGRANSGQAIVTFASADVLHAVLGRAAPQPVPTRGSVTMQLCLPAPGIGNRGQVRCAAELGARVLRAGGSTGWDPAARARQHRAGPSRRSLPGAGPAPGLELPRSCITLPGVMPAGPTVPSIRPCRRRRVRPHPPRRVDVADGLLDQQCLRVTAVQARREGGARVSE